MKVKVYRKMIERHKCPSRSDIDGTIKNITKELVAELSLQYLPSVGEILYIEEQDKRYKILNKIHVVSSGGGEYFVLEVIPFDPSSYHANGSNAWYENIPLVIDIQ